MKNPAIIDKNDLLRLRKGSNISLRWEVIGPSRLRQVLGKTEYSSDVYSRYTEREAEVLTTKLAKREGSSSKK